MDRPVASDDPGLDASTRVLDDDRSFPQSRAAASGWAAALLPLGGVAAVWATAIAWWPTLPARIPLHFDGSGVPDRWGPASVANWFMLPFIATWIAALVGGVGVFLPALARTWPGLVNVPQKKRWMALSPDARVRTIDPLRWLLGFVGLLVNGAWLWILWGTRWVAMDPDPANPTRTLGGVGLVLVLVGVMLAGVLLATLRMRTLVLREGGSTDPPSDVAGAGLVARDP